MEQVKIQTQTHTRSISPDMECITIANTKAGKFGDQYSGRGSISGDMERENVNTTPESSNQIPVQIGIGVNQ